MNKDNRRKKILIVGPAYPYRGGNALFVSSLYEALKEDFEVVLFNYKLLYPSILFPGTTQFDKSSNPLLTPPSQRVVNSINPLNWISVANKINNENLDLVVFDWWHPFFGPCHFTITKFLSKQLKNKILFITENFHSHESNVVDSFLTKLGLKNASAFLTLSKQVESELKSLADERKIYRTELPVYDCYNSEFDEKDIRRELQLSSNDKVLLFFGYVRKYKGLDLLISALPMVLKELPETKLLVVGEFYDSPESYKQLAHKLNVSDKIIFINKFIPNEEVSKFYSVSDVVVLPYRSATQSGILNVAYGLNKPVIVTDVGGLSEFIENEKTGLVVEPNDKEKLANAIIEFFVLDKSIDFASAIKQKNQQNSFSKISNLLENIIETVDK